MSFPEWLKPKKFRTPKKPMSLILKMVLKLLLHEAVALEPIFAQELMTYLNNKLQQAAVGALSPIPDVALGLASPVPAAPPAPPEKLAELLTTHAPPPQPLAPQKTTPALPTPAPDAPATVLATAPAQNVGTVGANVVIHRAADGSDAQAS